MMNHKHRKSWISIIALFLAVALLPLSALALTEDQLEPAPEITAAAQVNYEYQYLPAAGTPWNRQPVSDFTAVDPQFTADNGFSRPWLSNMELARTRRLMEQAAAGEVSYTGPSIVNASGDAFSGIGVYPLNPADYDGETFYVLLPQFQPLTDEQILALIAAFDELGIAFDPDSLGGRNCCRNTYQSETRYITDEEQARLDTIKMLVWRGELTMEDIPAGTLDCCIPVDRSSTVYYKRFTLYPYRSMTDDELSLLALRTESRWEDDPEEVLRFAVDAARGAYRDADSLTVWSMELDDICDPTEGKYTIVYYVNLEKDDPEGIEAGRYTNVYVDVVKDPGNAPEIAGIDLDYYDSSSAGGNKTPGTREEVIAAARNWAEANLQVPDGKMPESWDVGYWEELSGEDAAGSGQEVTLYGQTPEWDVNIYINRNTLAVGRVSLVSKKWHYPEEMDAPSYLPSSARPANREQVSADEKTDRQMVIRHTDYPDPEDGFYLPWLTDLELARTRKLMEQMAAGEVAYTGPSAVNASGTMDGRVGVYPLNPEDYDGETFYVLLPQYETLTDEQILSLIAAFDELGIPFDPDALNGRNCSRNFWFRQTRALTESEEAKLKAVRGWVREGLKKQDSIAPGTPNYYVEMEWSGDNASFHFYPYRELTYDEMAVLAMNEYSEADWEDEPAVVEKLATDFVSGLLRKLSKLTVQDEEVFFAPLDRDGVISYILYLDNEYTSRLSYRGWDIFVMEKKESGGEPEIARIDISYPMNYEDEKFVPERTDEELIGAVKAWVEENLQFPDGQVPEWTVSRRDTEYPIAARRTVCVEGRMQDWTVTVEMNQLSLDVWGVMLDNNRWYPED